MSETGFEGIDNVLNTDYNVDKELEKLETQSKKLVERKSQSKENKDLEATIEDKEYLEFELKLLIQNTNRIMEVLEQDIKIGTKPRYHEVYATLVKTVLDGLKELRELNVSIEQLKLQREKLEVRKKEGGTSSNYQQVNFHLSGSDLYNMFEKAKAESELNKIEADFKITDE